MTDDPLAPFARAPERAGVFCDFDGVLADIAARPDEAAIRPGVGELLADLQQRLGRIAVVTGRPVAYVAAMIPMAIDVVGLYGLEWRFDGEFQSLDEAEDWRAAIGATAEAAVHEFGAEAVEPKGLSLTLHYRNGGRPSAMEAWVRDQAGRTGLDARPAKRSFELHPPIRRDKGTVVLELAGDLDPVAYIGDDLGDLPAFDGLDDLAARGTTTVRVAVDSDEAPPVLLTRADHIVAGPDGAEAMLRHLLELIIA
jgi:trehalose 6-phosphate phosphatase